MLEDERVGNGELSFDLRVHHVHIGLINGEAFFGQGGDEVDGNMVQIRVTLPVLVQNEQELIHAARSEHRNQTSPSSAHYFVDET